LFVLHNHCRTRAFINANTTAFAIVKVYLISFGDLAVFAHSYVRTEDVAVVTHGAYAAVKATVGFHPGAFGRKPLVDFLKAWNPLRNTEFLDLPPGLLLEIVQVKF
jgi:hypothetical protein